MLLQPPQNLFLRQSASQKHFCFVVGKEDYFISELEMLRRASNYLKIQLRDYKKYVSYDCWLKINKTCRDFPSGYVNKHSFYYKNYILFSHTVKSHFVKLYS